MGKRILCKGNIAVVEAAIAAGCQCYFGYPITPQNEIPAYMSIRMPQEGRVFLQAESEIAAVSMVFGASAVGVRAMTSSSSPGVSLKMEGISYLAGAELPAGIVNMSRGGPGLGNIGPSQADYFQSTKGGGHGDYRMFVLAPSSVQELYDLTYLSFDIADKYRNPVMILGDGMLGQMLEPAIMDKNAVTESLQKPWALTGAGNRPQNVIKSMYLDVLELRSRNWMLHQKYKDMEQDVMVEIDIAKDADLLIVAFGSAARICKTVVKMAGNIGMKVGLVRPITLFPFPSMAISDLCDTVSRILVVEFNTGQMLEDVKLAVNGRVQVSFMGYPGGAVPTPEEIFDEIKEFLK